MTLKNLNEKKYLADTMCYESISQEIVGDVRDNESVILLTELSEGHGEKARNILVYSALFLFSTFKKFVINQTVLFFSYQATTKGVEILRKIHSTSKFHRYCPFLIGPYLKLRANSSMLNFYRYHVCNIPFFQE